MASYAFGEVNPDYAIELSDVRDCQYCSRNLVQHPYEVSHWRAYRVGGLSTFFVCERCGWWHASARLDDSVATFDSGSPFTDWSLGGCGALKTLDLRDITWPLQEVRDYLAAKYHRRGELHPRLFELTVGSVFGDLGYRSFVTAYSSDGGVDVVLRSGDGELIGVQVKQTRHRIEAEQIRAFTGALFLGNYTRGVFVTTSGFRRGAVDAARQSLYRGLPIELLDAERFLEILTEAQSGIQRVTTEWLEDRLEKLVVVREESVPWRNPQPS